MPNVNIPETETSGEDKKTTYQEKLWTWSYQEREEGGGLGGDGLINNREDMSKYELTADMTENRQYWKMMVKTGPQRSGDGL